MRSVVERKVIEVRNPYSTRPYQHVLEPLALYLIIAEQQYNDISYADYYNVGPDDCDYITTGELVELFCKYWGEGADWVNKVETNVPHEANFLRLDCSKVKATFGWKPRWHIEKCMRKTCEFSKAWMQGENLAKKMDEQIIEFMEGK